MQKIKKCLASRKKYLQSADIMNADRRIVPEKHISYLLEEDTISERTIEVKKLLHDSPEKIHHVAHTWMGHNGLNPMARVIIHHIPEVPKKSHSHHREDTHSIHHDTSVHHANTHHDSHHRHEDSHRLHDEYKDTHSPHEHSSHGHRDNHGGDTHHGHSESEHHGGTFSSFVSTGHWFGDQGAFIFGMFGRIVGEIIGYILKMAAIILIFGPTRTILLIFLIGILLNVNLTTTLPVWTMAGVAGVIHLIFTIMNKIIGGHGESHGGGGHGHSDGHGGGHEHH